MRRVEVRVQVRGGGGNGSGGGVGMWRVGCRGGADHLHLHV